MTIRTATLLDIPALSQLITELGYPTQAHVMEERFNHLSTHPDYQTFVATLETGEVVGMIGLNKNLFWEQTGYQVRIIAFVVRSTARQQGVGEALIRAGEQWAGEVGAVGVSLNCGNRPERAAAHRFYVRMGFTARSTGYRKLIAQRPDHQDQPTWL